MSATVLFLILLVQFADGRRDAYAYVVPSGRTEDCIETGMMKADEITALAPGSTVVFMCREEADPIATPAPTSSRDRA